jgi:hypothetical protein
LVEKIIPDSEGGEITITIPEFEAALVDADPDDIVNRKSQKATSPGPAPEKTVKAAKWLLKYLVEQCSEQWTALKTLFDAAGAMGFVGVQKPDKYGHLRWSIPATLYQARNLILTLPDPDNGWMIDDMKEGNCVRWRAVPTSTGSNSESLKRVDSQQVQRDSETPF